MTLLYSQASGSSSSPKTPNTHLDDNGLPVLPPLYDPVTGKPAPTLASSVTTNPAKDNKPVTLLDLYKVKVYRAIGARWYSKINDALNLIPPGHIRIQYTVYADGSVTTKVLDGGDQFQQLLLSISRNAIMEAAPFTPFSEALRQQVGTSFTDDFTFSIYDNGPDSSLDQSQPAQASPAPSSQAPKSHSGID